MIRSMIKISTVLSCVGSLKFFDLIFTMTNGGPAHLTEVLASHLYNQSFKFWDYSYGSAPVSYTHLDVYKRQLLNGSNR